MTTIEVLIEELGEERVKELDNRALLVLVEWAMIQYHEKQVKNCSIPAGSSQRGLLIAFVKDWYKGNPLVSDEKQASMVDKWLAFHKT